MGSLILAAYGDVITDRREGLSCSGQEGRNVIVRAPCLFGNLVGRRIALAEGDERLRVTPLRSAVFVILAQQRLQGRNVAAFQEAGRQNIAYALIVIRVQFE